MKLRFLNINPLISVSTLCFGSNKEKKTYHSSESGIAVKGGFRQYRWYGRSHSSHMICWSGLSLQPHSRHPQYLHLRRGLSWHCWQYGALSRLVAGPFFSKRISSDVWSTILRTCEISRVSLAKWMSQSKTSVSFSSPIISVTDNFVLVLEVNSALVILASYLLIT